MTTVASYWEKSQRIHSTTLRLGSDSGGTSASLECGFSSGLSTDSAGHGVLWGTHFTPQKSALATANQRPATYRILVASDRPSQLVLCSVSLWCLELHAA